MLHGDRPPATDVHADEHKMSRVVVVWCAHISIILPLGKAIHPK